MNACPSAIDRAHAAWGADLPDWVRVLAERCDQSSQSQVAREVGYSGAAISCVIRGKYAGDVRAVEQAVRGAYLRAVVDCPVLGDLPSHQCLEHQRRPFAATNRLRVDLYRACQTCPNARRAGREKGKSPC